MRTFIAALEKRLKTCALSNLTSQELLPDSLPETQDGSYVTNANTTIQCLNRNTELSRILQASIRPEFLTGLTFYRPSWLVLG